MIDSKEILPKIIEENDWAHAKCDKYDYMIAAFCGGAAGLVDAFFVGAPNASKLGTKVDKVADDLVKHASQMFYKFDNRPEKPKKAPKSLVQCISYLEQAFPVNYDARYAKDLIVEDGVLSRMRPGNHHLLSLGHSPDLIGLVFSIINQFYGYATFVDHGHLIHAVPAKTSGAIPYLQGGDFVSRLFCGFVNWLGHLMSDLVGSSSTRRDGKGGRGAGIPMPFYELFLACDFGNIDGKTFAETMIQVFEEGYDFRFAATMAIPVVMEELMIKVFWMIRQKFFRHKEWKESIPTKKHADLRVMILVGNATLCVVDGVDAGIRSGGNPVSFILHLNIIGWIRLIMFVLKELYIRYGSVIKKALDEFLDQVLTQLQTLKEKQRIVEFYGRLEQHEQCLDLMLKEFIAEVEEEYRQLNVEIEGTFDETLSSKENVQHSIKMADMSNVDENKIIRNYADLEKYLS